MMKIQALVITEGHHVEFEIPNDSTLEQVKAKAIEIADGEECTWKPEVHDITIVRREGDYTKAISVVTAIDDKILKRRVFDHFVKKLELNINEEESFARHCDYFIVAEEGS